MPPPIVVQAHQQLIDLPDHKVGTAVRRVPLDTSIVEVAVVEIAQRSPHEGLPDEWVAYELSKDGFRQSWRSFVTIGLVARERRQARLKRAWSRERLPQGLLTLQQVARRLSVSQDWILQHVLDGDIRIEPKKDQKRVIIPADGEVMAKLRELKEPQTERCAQSGVLR